ncbi:MAG: NADH:ubiquinone oxidoreductase [Deltaproteobacteria bacterium]|nr:MAG: NADH:ubiquinone oxidoreductase [Deltaproteobacteria bacterium]
MLALLSLLALASPPEATMLLDDFSRADERSALGTRWSAMSDRVMGGVSDVRAARVRSPHGDHLHLAGEVRDVPGYGSPGFVQVGLELGGLDASDYTGLRLVVRGDGQRYGAHLRTPDTRRPWQSWRGSFTASTEWTEVRIPFTDFEPYRIARELDLTRLTRLSLIAVDRTGAADLRIAEVGLYR